MAFAFCPFWNKIIVSEFWVLVVMGSIWIPQIISLAISGKKNTINGSFIYLSALQSMFLPLYINLIDDNIMFYKPNRKFFLVALAYLVLQLLVLIK